MKGNGSVPMAKYGAVPVTTDSALFSSRDRFGNKLGERAVLHAAGQLCGSARTHP